MDEAVARADRFEIRNYLTNRRGALNMIEDESIGKARKPQAFLEKR